MHGSVEAVIEVVGGGMIQPVVALVEPAHDAPARSASLVPTRADWGQGWQTVAKRGMDIVGASLLLLVVVPLLIVVAVGVRMSSPGPVLFRQPRVGRGGHHFLMLKFRTFPVDHVDVVQSLPAADCPLRFGRFLRRTSIDELPQLWNAVRGDMSLVGPRPERPRFAEQLGASMPTYRERHRAPAGITGLAQIHGLCGPTSIPDRVQADNDYIESWTVWRDVRILLRTVPTVFRKIHW